MGRLSAGEALLQLEVIKLLLQVAWADLEVHAAEAALVLRHVRRLGLSDRDVQQVSDYLSGVKRLPPPDLALLRSRRDEVLQAVHEVISADERISVDEQTVLELIESALNV